MLLRCQGFDLGIQSALMASSLVLVNDALVRHAVDDGYGVLESGGSSGGVVSGRISYAYRDDAFYTDNNRGYFLSQEILDAGLDFSTGNRHWVFSIYGKNLLDDVNHGGDTQLPETLSGILPWGGTFSPLVKGRILGLEVSYRY